MNLYDRLHNPDRRTDELTPIREQRSGEERREPFVAPWRRRQIEKAGGPFVAVAWREIGDAA